MPIIHGHRGARGLLPENTLPSFGKAIDFGVHAIELDIIMTKQGDIVVSHEPWINPFICIDPSGKPYENAERINLYEMPLKEIQQINCGGLVHPDFPYQQIYSTFKPTLKEVLDYLHFYYADWLASKPTTFLDQIKLNIEVKSDPNWYEHHQLSPQNTAQLLHEFIDQHAIGHLCLVQSFDIAFLESFYQLDPTMYLGLLVDEHEDIQEKLHSLSFLPHFCNPYYGLVTPELMDFLHRQEILSLCWTVNRQEDAVQMIIAGVDGIITDYPDLFH